ncbi:MAG TPA: EAL domain-containing protein, partial [Novosphingobium sp.]|nr:EAL domain-containing protein [Novosphingobium sp.]
AGSGRAVVARIDADAALLAPFAAAHHLVQPRLLPAGSQPPRLSSVALAGGIVLAWVPADPSRSWQGQLPMILLVVAGLFGGTGFIVLRMSTAITSDLIASEARARHLAFHDTLTGLANRAMMFEKLRSLLAISRRYYGDIAVHCLDLDRFKEVNDTLGHPAGDELIQQVARRLTGLCRESDTVARLGGDEFVILQPEATSAGASHLAERVLKSFEEPFQLAFGTVEVGVSIGVTVLSNPELDPSEALRQADLALYSSKEGGRNRITFFEPDMDAALRLRRGLETDLRHALTHDGLYMVYQPQMDHRGKVAGVEALLRWLHPDKGLIPPAMFVPLAEETGLILDLGEYVFKRVFAETADWLHTRVAINVSPLQLRSPVFMAMLTRLVAEHRIDPSRYEIEITETALLGDDGVTRDNITMLKQEGFSIALDDFGTGYSSLNSLKRFSVDKIKIDRSFVANLEADEEAEALIDAMVKLGRALRLNIVAEGVETEAQRERLAHCGCHQFQGYLMSRPMPASDILRLVGG